MTPEMWRDLFAIVGIGVVAAVGGHGCAWLVRRARAGGLSEIHRPGPPGSTAYHRPADCTPDCRYYGLGGR